MVVNSCVSATGKFIYGIHKPRFTVSNMREINYIRPLGATAEGLEYDNLQNFPADDVHEEHADWIFEIPNPFPFRGVTYICKSWADEAAADTSKISLPAPPKTSFDDFIRSNFADSDLSEKKIDALYGKLPESVLLGLAATSTDPKDLIRLARLSCSFKDDSGTSGKPVGLLYTRGNGGRLKPVIHNHELFEVLVNNIYLPDDYKEVMVLRPGVQGGSEIVGEWQTDSESHVFEYLRRNSYIPWGHYAANMANDAVRYKIDDLSMADMEGLRHLYYQRTYLRMADQLELHTPAGRQTVSKNELEKLRLAITAALKKMDNGAYLRFNATLWGWNFGFDYSPSRYRLHASHQQIHQQYALLPAEVEAWHDHSTPADSSINAYGCGDLVLEFTERFHENTGKDFFEAYLKAIRNNKRMDNRPDRETSLVVFEDENVMLFVPKAQTSQWEIQLMTLNKVGNIIEADTATRDSLDRAMFFAQKIIAKLGARMVTSIEFPKRIGTYIDQRLLYSFLPKLPYSMGAFSEAQLRFINGHYPEDFATVCRAKLDEVLKELN